MLGTRSLLLGALLVLLAGLLPVLVRLRSLRHDQNLTTQRRQHGSLEQPGPRGQVHLEATISHHPHDRNVTPLEVYTTLRWIDDPPSILCRRFLGSLWVQAAEPGYHPEAPAWSIDPGLFDTFSPSLWVRPQWTLWPSSLAPCPAERPGDTHRYEFIDERPVEVWACLSPDGRTLLPCHDGCDHVRPTWEQAPWVRPRLAAMVSVALRLGWLALAATLALRTLRPLAPDLHPWFAGPDPGDSSLSRRLLRPWGTWAQIALLALVLVTLRALGAFWPMLVGVWVLVPVSLALAAVAVVGARPAIRAARWWRRLDRFPTPIGQLHEGPARVRGSVALLEDDHVLMHDYSGQCAVELGEQVLSMAPASPAPAVGDRWELAGQMERRSVTLDDYRATTTDRLTLTGIHGGPLYLSVDPSADQPRVRALVVGTGVTLLTLAATLAAAWYGVMRL